MFAAQHPTDPLSSFAGAASREVGINAGTKGDPEQTAVLKQLLTSFMLTNRLLAASYGSDTGISDRRNGQSYYIDVGVEIPLVDNTPGFGVQAYLPEVAVDTSRIAALISPSLGDVDIRFSVGVDSFSVHRNGDPPAGFKYWPITVSAPLLQKINGARYLTVLSGESGTALSGTAQTVVYGELPSLINFKMGFQSPIPTRGDGVLTETLFPLVFNADWLAANPTTLPVIPGTATPLWESSNIYAITLRLYVIPTITPRIRLQSS